MTPTERRKANASFHLVLALAFVPAQAPLLAACAPTANAQGSPATAAAAHGATPAPGRPACVTTAALPFDASTEAAFTDSAARVFCEQAPDIPVRVEGPMTLGLDGRRDGKYEFRISLDRIWGVCQSAGPRCEGEVRDFVAKVVHTVAAREQPPTREQIVAALRPRAYLDAIGGEAKTGAVIEPFGDDLIVVYFVDDPDSTRSVSASDLQTLHLARRDLPALARANVAKRLAPALDALGAGKAGDVAVLETGNYFESSRLLLGDEWTALASKVGHPILVAVPANDVVVVAIGPNDVQLAKLRDVASSIYDQAQRPISRHLFRWDAGKWTALP